MPKLGNWGHLCIDMQRIFAEETPWHVNWMGAVLPKVEELAGRFPEKTIFTRFVPPVRGEDMPGAWQKYYRKWWMVTRKHMPAE
jgi:nicotinamidase-related amidase